MSFESTYGSAQLAFAGRDRDRGSCSRIKPCCGLLVSMARVLESERETESFDNNFLCTYLLSTNGHFVQRGLMDECERSKETHDDSV